MAFLVLGSWLVTRHLSTETSLSRGQNLLEIVVDIIQGQIRDVTQQDPSRYLPFVGTLFLFIAVSNTLAIFPGFQAPTGSLSTTAALALCVFVSSPLFGIADRGLRGFLKRSEEHTSDLQSLMRHSYAVFCLKKTKQESTSNEVQHII